MGNDILTKNDRQIYTRDLGVHSRYLKPKTTRASPKLGVFCIHRLNYKYNRSL